MQYLMLAMGIPGTVAMFWFTVDQWLEYNRADD